MAWNSNDSCTMYNFNSMSPVVKGSSKNGSVVAFKVTSPENQCPVGLNPPTFDNQNATGRLYVNNYPPSFPYYVNYTMYFDNGIWKMSYIHKGQELRKLTKSKDIYARIDGVRYTTCRSNPKTADCRSPKGFKFTGRTISNFNNYKWVSNSSAMATKNDNCLVMVFKGTGSVKIDVRGCPYDTAPLKTQLVFCSRRAWSFPDLHFN
ncbi:Protein CBR-CLEC-171 [Caenorhabditis briggsae]|uniref:Protein CBR-CLEC-171 n=1 Tax=Caenorhabditis briggsae TaxID=6238 RepID=A8X0S6_CAEBR|nr:Protein CBR-CLEC-171 [Caenorhabditis briggsae]CAP26236.2 Protein CBR-CLEC-171 [Caenorhabditis briggsae]